MRHRACKSLIANEATDPVNVIVVAIKTLWSLFPTNRQMLAQKSNRHSRKRNEMMLIINSGHREV